MTKFLNISVDNTLGGNSSSDETVSSQKAIKTYIDNHAGMFPSQTGNAGKFLSTNGTTPSWTTVDYSTVGALPNTTIADDIGGANKDLSNLSSVGKNISNWSSNVSNCIVEIPQDLNFELSNGTLTLKQNSKVYIKSDTTTPTYNMISDITLTKNVDGTYFVYYTGSQLSAYSKTEYTYNTLPYGVSFPLAEITVSGGAISSINQVFNGLGYIGSTVFVLPGVKTLCPNGRNANGTLNNIYYTYTTVKTGSRNLTSVNVPFWLRDNGNIDFSSGVSYDPVTNYIVGTTAKYAQGGLVDMSAGVISNFRPKVAFHAVDYNDAAILGGNNKFTGNNTFSGSVGLGSYATAITPSTSDNDESVATTAWGNNFLNGMRSNCITYIPQDIKLELSSGTLKLKDGSKIYIPNGSGVFDTITISNDLTATAVVDTTWLVFAKNNGLQLRGISNCTSGTSQPSGNYLAFYNTSTNSISLSGGDGSFVSGYSFPIAIITSSGGAITSIDQVFNGFGYIGSTVFALPGVKGLVPNGRNADGTLNNSSFTTTAVQVFTGSGPYTRLMRFEANGNFTVSNFALEYDEQKNKMMNSGVEYSIMVVGDAYWDSSSKITSFNSKTAFHALDWNDLNGKILNDRGIRTVVETYKNGSNWYRIWSDGWCEQGGHYDKGSLAIDTATTIQLLKAYPNIDYTLVAQSSRNDNQGGSINNQVFINHRTKTEFTARCYGDGTSQYIDWYACGYTS